jgi:hypothetical protein
MSVVSTVTELHVEGYEEFRAKVDELSADKSKTVLVLFSGSKDEQGSALPAFLFPFNSHYCSRLKSSEWVF